MNVVIAALLSVMVQDDKAMAGHRDKVNSVAFHPSGEMPASGSEDGIPVLWDK